MRVYTVHVDVSSHDDLRDGVLVTCTSRVRVLADDMNDARLVASQMAGCHGMPTGARVVDVDDL